MSLTPNRHVILLFLACAMLFLSATGASAANFATPPPGFTSASARVADNPSAVAELIERFAGASR